MLDLDQEYPPWAFRLAGRTWTAQRVSGEQVLGYLTAIERANAAPTPAAQERGRLTATVRLLRQAFPWKVVYWWRPDQDPVHRIQGLDPEAQKAVLLDFFGWLGVKLALPTPATPTSPPGSASASAAAPASPSSAPSAGS